MNAFSRLALTAVLSFAATTASASEFYEGQTIRIVIPFSAGGGTDTFGRLIATHLGRHIPGSPTVIAENVTGGGGILGSNEFGRAARDGMTLLTASGHLNLRAFLGLEGLELDLADLTPVVAAPMGHVVAIRADAGISDATQIGQIPGRVTMGITDPVGLVETLMALEMLGIEIRAVPGFPGRGDTRLAFERGELVIDSQATPAYLARVVPLVEEGTAIPGFAIGFTAPDGSPLRDPAVPDLITAAELYQQIHGRAPQGPAAEAYRLTANLVQNTRGTIWVHSDVPAEALAALRTGVDAMVADPEFQAAVESILEGYDIISGDGLDQIAADLAAADPAVLQWMRDLMTERFEVRFNR